jgi:hypothetical protein
MTAIRGQVERACCGVGGAVRACRPAVTAFVTGPVSLTCSAALVSPGGAARAVPR